MEDPAADLTTRLRAAAEGDHDAREDVYNAVYARLHSIAHAQLRRGRTDDMSTTVLVHEAYLKMFDGRHLTMRDRSHFLSLSARIMRQILVDYFRRSQTDRRGGSASLLTLDEEQVGLAAEGEVVLAVHDALDHLAELDPRMASVVECRFFGGLTQTETAQALGVSDRTVRSAWKTARTWLAHRLSSPEQSSPD